MAKNRHLSNNEEVDAYMAGMGVGGYMFNKGFGNPMGKSLNKASDIAQKGVKKLRGKSSINAPDKPNNDSTNHHNNEPNESQQNKFDHDDSFNKNIPNSTTKSENVKDIKGFSGKNTTEICIKKIISK